MFCYLTFSGTPFDWLKGMTGSSANPIKFASSLQLEEKYKATVSADFSLDAGETLPFVATLTISSKTTKKVIENIPVILLAIVINTLCRSISDAKPEYSGTYFCRFRDGSNVLEDKVTLTVLRKFYTYAINACVNE